MENFLKSFPGLAILKREMNGRSVPEWREVNAHIHTPYSFSAFPDMETLFRMAADEDIAVLGINDFYVADGYSSFHKGCLANKIFPLFNIEFIGLLKDEQQKNIRINDPNNPGRIYFCGKGLDYPFKTGFFQQLQLKRVIRESQNQIREMIAKLNLLFEKHDPSLNLDYDSVKREYAQVLVRERHLAKAVRILVERKYADPDQQIRFLEALYGNKKCKAGVEDKALLENEIRSNLLKSGGAAFVEENERSFLDLKKLLKIIINAGGIPCYPVLLDDNSGNFTEFESDPVRLMNSLREYGIECIELIPARNNGSILKKFVEFFHDKGFIITFGTEHNTPQMAPLTVKSRGEIPLDEALKKIAWEGACIIAAHQYLRADGRQGYVLPDGTHSKGQKEELAQLGEMVIEYYKTNYDYEAGDK